MMDAGRQLLETLRAGIRGGHVDWAQPMPEECWRGLFALARQQHVLPLVVEAVYPSPAFLALPEQARQSVKGEARRLVIGQTMRAQALLGLYTAMTAAGLHPLVMKGAACRSTYPVPEIRPSSDEDILVPQSEFAASAACLEAYGCKTMGEADVERDFEISFMTPEGLHIELHKHPFSPDSATLRGANDFFEGAWERGFDLNVNGSAVRTMSPHDHMLYLVLHAFKHLIHSGFGIRQVCDILLWAEVYEREIDWKRLKEQCHSVRSWGFVQAVFQIGDAYLGFDQGERRLPAELAGEPGLGEVLLSDLLAGGVFGGADLSRKHSGTVTLGAVESQRSGKRYSLLQTLFPPCKSLEKRYPYLQRFPVLLPLAWLQRMFRYGRELRAGKDDTNRAEDSLRIGKERTRLLRKLDVID